MHNLEKAADRKSARKIFGRAYAPPNTSHVKNTEVPAHACGTQEPGRLATLSSRSTRPHTLCKYPIIPRWWRHKSRPGNCQRDGHMSYTACLYTSNTADPHPQSPDTQLVQIHGRIIKLKYWYFSTWRISHRRCLCVSVGHANFACTQDKSTETKCRPATAMLADFKLVASFGRNAFYYLYFGWTTAF